MGPDPAGQRSDRPRSGSRPPSEPAGGDEAWLRVAPEAPPRGGRAPSRGPAARGSSAPPGSEERLPVKASMGVILCRVGPAGAPQVLLVHKRYTYAFADFVHGRYARGRIGPDRSGGGRAGAARAGVAALLDRMTREELFDIWSLNFGQMWYRVWLTLDNRDLYNKKHAKFQTTFMRDDGGEALRGLVACARAQGSLLWEVPKGRRLGAREADVLCAVRELREETGVDKREYRLLPGVTRRVAWVSAGTRYDCLYYVGVANPHLAATSGGGLPLGRHALRSLCHVAEASESRWFSLEQVRLLAEAPGPGEAPGGHLEALIAPAFRLMKLYRKGRWKRVGRPEGPRGPG